MPMIQLFFIKNINSAAEIIYKKDYFSVFSGFKINKTKCEIAGFGVMKEVKLALCGMKCVKFNKMSSKYLDYFILKIKKKKMKKTFSIILKSFRIFKICGE